MRQRMKAFICRCVLGCLCFLCLVTQRAGAQTSPSLDAPVNVFVSILPQAYFLERVGGNRVEVSVMVGPGQSPHTYEPTPKQMAALGKARLYFRAGVEFENAWMDRITHINPRIKVIDTRRGIELLPMAAHHDHDESDHVHHGNGLRDPHIWLSLRLVKIQAETICEALEAEVPSDGLYFRKNLEAFHHDLDSLDREISETLQAARIRKFMVFHPAWGYLARDYGLEQIPIEIEGKEPNAKDLVRIIKEADEEGIKVLLVQKQFSRKSADAVAQAIGGTVIRIDGLPRDYLNDMRVIVETLKTALQ